MTDHVMKHEDAPVDPKAPEAPKVEKRYRVLVDGLELTNKIGGASGKSFKWDKDAEVGDAQVSEEEATALIADGKIELIAGEPADTENQG